jgi:hypothetical protein
VEIRSLELEYNGPLSATAAIRGVFWHEELYKDCDSTPKRRNLGSEFTVRIRVYKGQSFIRTWHTWVYEGNPDADFLKGVGLSLRLEGVDADKATLTTLGDDGAPLRWKGSDGPRAELRQPSWMDYELLAYDKDDRSSIVSQGRRSAQWLSLGGDRFGAAVGIEEMAETSPGALRVDASTGLVTQFHIPDSLGPMDMRRYSREWAQGESRPNGQGQATGVAHTQRGFIYFHRADEEAGKIQAVNQHFQDHALVRAPARWYSTTRVAGALHPYDPGNYPRLEKEMSWLFDFILHHQRKWHWYGLWYYGDNAERYNSGGNQRWDTDWGRWGWNASQGISSHFPVLQFLRRPSPEYLRYVYNNAYYISDVITKHTTQYPERNNRRALRNMKGFFTRHGVQPWSDGYQCVRGSQTYGVALAYYLTGDSRLRDFIREVSEVPFTHGWYDKGVDSTGAVLQVFYVMGEMTQDPKWHHLLKRIAYDSSDYLAKNGYWPASTPFDPRSGAYTGVSGDHRNGIGFFLACWGQFQMIEQMQGLYGDRKLKQTLIRIGDRGFRRSLGWDYGYTRRQVFGTAYRLSGQNRFLDAIKELGAHQWLSRPRQEGDFESNKPDKVNMTMWIGAQTPYLMSALAEHGLNERGEKINAD